MENSEQSVPGLLPNSAWLEGHGFGKLVKAVRQRPDLFALSDQRADLCSCGAAVHIDQHQGSFRYDRCHACLAAQREDRAH